MRLRLGILALTASAVLAAPSLAADHTATLSASAPTFSWDGAAASAFNEDLISECGDPNRHCEDILLNLSAPGDLKVSLESAAGQPINDPSGQVCGDTPCASYQDVDGVIYKSNDKGEAVGEPLGNEDTDCGSSFASEACELKGLAAGYYLIHVDYFFDFENSYKGTATLTTTGPAPTTEAPPATSPAPSSQPAPASQPAPSSTPAPTQAASKPAAKKTSKRAACTKKAKKIKNKRKRAKALKKCKKIKK